MLPVLGATVDVLNEWGNTVDTTTTRLNLDNFPPTADYSTNVSRVATYQVIAHKSGYSSDSTTVLVPAEGVTGVDLFLESNPTTGVIVRVRDYSTNDRLGGATIGVKGPDTDLTASASAAGEWARSLGLGTYDITVDLEGYRSETRSVTLDESTPFLPVHLTLWGYTYAFKGTGGSDRIRASKRADADGGGLLLEILDAADKVFGSKAYKYAPLEKAGSNAGSLEILGGSGDDTLTVLDSAERVRPSPEVQG